MSTGHKCINNAYVSESEREIFYNKLCIEMLIRYQTFIFHAASCTPYLTSSKFFFFTYLLYLIYKHFHLINMITM